MSDAEQKTTKKADSQEQVIDLYQGAKRIHPKKVSGRFAKLRIAVLVITQ